MFSPNAEKCSRNFEIIFQKFDLNTIFNRTSKILHIDKTTEEIVLECVLTYRCDVTDQSVIK